MPTLRDTKFGGISLDSIRNFARFGSRIYVRRTASDRRGKKRCRIYPCAHKVLKPHANICLRTAEIALTTASEHNTPYEKQTKISQWNTNVNTLRCVHVYNVHILWTRQLLPIAVARHRTSHCCSEIRCANDLTTHKQYHGSSGCSTYYTGRIFKNNARLNRYKIICKYNILNCTVWDHIIYINLWHRVSKKKTTSDFQSQVYT